MAHNHSVIDADARYKIDGVSRVISNASNTQNEKRFLVQGDHNSEKFVFEMPRYIDGHDMSECNVVQIHHLNVDALDKNKIEDVYSVNDLQVSKDNEEVVVFSWLISGNCTKYAGSLNFIIRFCCFNEGDLEYSWNTTVFKGVSILAGMDCSDSVVEQYSDILDEWEGRIQNNITNEYKIAGIRLGDYISDRYEEGMPADVLHEALDTYPVILKDGVPDYFTPGKKKQLLIDTTTNEVYYCTGRVLSGINWVKISSMAEGPSEETIDFDPTEYDLPVLYLEGDITGIDKDNSVDLNCSFWEKKIVNEETKEKNWVNVKEDSCSLKWQGSSSLAYEKKNYTIKFDSAFEVVPGWGEQKKYCLKANFIDYSHARNVVCAKIWSEIVRNRASKNRLTSLSNGGAIDGFPVIVMLNGQFHGLYTYNIPKDAWMFGMGKNLYNGVPAVNGDGYFYDDKAVLNLDTLQLSNVIEAKNYCTTKAIAVEPNTEYMIPNIFESTICSYTANGGYDGTIPAAQITKYNDYWVITTKEYTKYLVFCFFKPTYTQYNDFYIKAYREAIVGADESTALDVAFKGKTEIDGKGIELEYAPVEDDIDWIKTSLNEMINACISSDGSDIDTNIAKYLDLESVVDYFLFTTFIGGFDMMTRNYLLATFDGVKWSMSAYDMDSTFGLKWDGKEFFDALDGPTFEAYKNKHRIMELIYRFKSDTLKTRWKQLRNGVLSETYISQVFENFIGKIPSTIYLKDFKKYPSIPNTSANCLEQILNWVHYRLSIMDKRVNSLPSQDVPNSPVGVNLYNGLSKVWKGKYFYNSSSVNLNTLEVFGADAASSDYCLTKATPVKPNTEYIVPNIVDSTVCSYIAEGKFDGTLMATDGIITTKATTSYLLFCFFKPSYPDYVNFYIKERNANLYNGLSEFWGDKYYTDGKANLNVDTLELMTAIPTEWYNTTKAIAVKPNTQYAVPNIGGSKVCLYTADGVYDGSIAASNGVITTKSTTGYLVFCFLNPVYSDFDNFYICELQIN